MRVARPFTHSGRRYFYTQFRKILRLFRSLPRLRNLSTFLTRKGIISPKLQLLSGHAEEKNLAIYRDLALSDVSAEYEEAMRSFPIR